MPSHRRDQKQTPAVQAQSSSDEDDQRNEDESSFKVRLSFSGRKPSAKLDVTSSAFIVNSSPTNSYRGGQTKSNHVPGRASYPPENFCPRLREGSQQQLLPSSRPNQAQPFPVSAPNTAWSRRNGTPNAVESASLPSPLVDRPFRCQECGRAFFDGSRLRTHLRIHSGDLPYECGLCFKSFISKYRLDRHQLIHSGTRAFKCELCGQTFVTKDKLNRHHVIHTGERLGCDQCEKTFSRRDKLTRHRLTVHFPKMD